MVKSRNYVIWGSAGHAKVLANLIALVHGRVAAVVDRNPEATSVLADVPLLVGTEGFSDWQHNKWDGGELSGLVAIGGALGRDRLEIQEFFRARGVRLEPIVHPDASVCATAVLGSGTQVLAQANVSSDTRIGEACIINHHASVDHECYLGDGIHLAPGSTLCGCIEIRDNVLVGAGAVVLPRVTIGENAVIGAGAVVTRDVPARRVVVGCPAKAIQAVQN
jgi:sugar O-acyltransferase (sialic acid O-acetyltransferase NeuD family)